MRNNNGAICSNSYLILSAYTVKFARDMYLPALPAIAIALNSSNDLAQLTVSIYFIGLALSRIIATPLSDIFGRRRILLYFIPIFIVGSIIIIFSQSISVLLLGRFLQALGIGCTTFIGHALIHDVYEIKKTTKVLAWLSIFMVWAPAVATTLGGLLQMHLGWQSIFIFLSFWGILTWFYIYYFLPKNNRVKISSRQVLLTLKKNTLSLCRNASFVYYLLPFGLIMSGYAIYFTAAPFIIIDTLSINPADFGLLTFVLIFSMLCGRLLAGFLCQYLNSKSIILLSLSCAFSGSIMLLILSIFSTLSVTTFILPMVIYFLGLGLLLPTIKAAVMYLVSHTAGIATALLGLSDCVFSAILSAVTTQLSIRSTLPIAIMLCIISASALGILIVQYKKITI